jgi:hypothetical protein
MPGVCAGRLIGVLPSSGIVFPESTMRRPALLLVPLALAASALFAPAMAQSRSSMPKAVVSIYRVSPGQHLAFLKWMAAREAADRDAGIPATQWYAHLNGDSWDYVAIAPNLDDATQDKVDAAEAKRGLATGMRASLEFRQMIAVHTDTFAAGPFSAQQMVDAAGK